MPIYPAPQLPNWMNPDTQSVFDPLYQQVIKRAVSALGLTDPNSVMSVAGPMEAPLVSIYKNAAARQVGTNRFVQAATNVSHNFGIAADEFSKRYPRIAAHIFPWSGDPIETAAAALKPHMTDKVTSPLVLHVTPLGVAATDVRDGLNTARNIINHEGTHAAQFLGNSHSPELYSLVNELLPGDQIAKYAANPFEISARSAEVTPNILPSAKGGHTIDAVREIAERNRNKPAAKQILSMLADRDDKAWYPSTLDEWPRYNK